MLKLISAFPETTDSDSASHHSYHREEKGELYVLKLTYNCEFSITHDNHFNEVK